MIIEFRILNQSPIVIFHNKWEVLPSSYSCAKVANSIVAQFLRSKNVSSADPTCQERVSFLNIHLYDPHFETMTGWHTPIIIGAVQKLPSIGITE